MQGVSERARKKKEGRKEREGEKKEKRKGGRKRQRNRESGGVACRDYTSYQACALRQKLIRIDSETALLLKIRAKR